VRAVPEQIATQILGAAELFAERGLDETKMEDIAATTGVPKATLYYYFSGKADILAFLFHAVLEEVQTAVTTAATGTGSAEERLRRVIVAHLEVFRRLPMASRALQFDLGRAARIPELATRAEAAFVAPVRELLVEGARDGSLRPVPHPAITALVIMGAITTTGMNVLAMDSGRSVRTVANVVAAVVLDGLRPEDPRPEGSS
jgi:TetR/AcrR family transcriptional regulator